MLAGSACTIKLAYINGSVHLAYWLKAETQVAHCTNEQ
jgi:hypothetical protein